MDTELSLRKPDPAGLSPLERTELLAEYRRNHDQLDQADCAYVCELIAFNRAQATTKGEAKAKKKAPAPPVSIDQLI